MTRVFLGGGIWCLIFFVVVPCAWAVRLDLEPGLFTSYEHTDNYFGTAHDEKSENIFEIGPRIDLSALWPQAECFLSGHAAQSQHNRYSSDDSMEAGLDARAFFEGRYQELSINYAWLQSRSRDTLERAWGMSRDISGGFDWSFAHSERFAMDLGYAMAEEYVPYPDEDVSSRFGSLGLSFGLTRTTDLGTNFSYDTYRYDGGRAVSVSSAGLDLNHALTTRTSLGLALGYEHHRPQRQANEDIYTTSLLFEHMTDPYTSLYARAGVSWLRIEGRTDEDHRIHTRTDDTVDASLGMRREMSDALTMSMNCAQGYSHEYTSLQTGITKTRSADLLLEYMFNRDLRWSLDAGVTQRTPPHGQLETTDIHSRMDMHWRPCEHINVGLSYEYLGYLYGISDTLKNELRASMGDQGFYQYRYSTLDPEEENRYILTIEVIF